MKICYRTFLYIQTNRNFFAKPVPKEIIQRLDRLSKEELEKIRQQQCNYLEKSRIKPLILLSSSISLHVGGMMMDLSNPIPRILGDIGFMISAIWGTQSLSRSVEANQNLCNINKEIAKRQN